jgi:hypothetical protein
MQKESYHEPQTKSAPQFTTKDARDARIHYQRVAQIVNLIINRLIQTIDKKHADAFTPSVFQTIHALHGMFNGREVSEKNPHFRKHLYAAPHFGFRDHSVEDIAAIQLDGALSESDKQARIADIKARTANSAGRLVCRRLNDLEDAEAASGRQFFVIQRADGTTQEMTSYEGHPLLDVAESLYFAARQCPNYAANPSKAITTELLDEAIASLPERKPDGKVSASSERAPMDAGDLMSDAVLKGMWTKIITAAERTLTKEFDCGGDPELVAAKYAAKIVRIGKDIKQRLARERLSAFSSLGDEDADAPREGDERGADGKNNARQDEGGNFDETVPIYPDNNVGATDFYPDNNVGVADFYPDNNVGVNDDERAESAPFYPDIVVGVTDSQDAEKQDFTKTPITETANLTLQRALEYAAAGIAVFPLHNVFDGICSCRKGSECQNKGKHPRWRKGDLESGVDSATTDEATIRSWFGKWENTNLAIAMGGVLRLIALDSDPRNGGDASIYDLVEAHGEAWLETHIVRTGGGGHHFLYRLPEGIEVHKSKIAPGIDVKAAGGYLVAPPSVHASGRMYEVANNIEIAIAPEWIIEELTRAPDVQPSKIVDFQERSRTSASAAAARYFEDGERNNGLRDVMCGRWRRGYAEDATDLYRQMLEVRDTRCAPGKESAATDAQLWDMVQRTTRKFARGERASA